MKFVVLWKVEEDAVFLLERQREVINNWITPVFVTFNIERLSIHSSPKDDTHGSKGEIKRLPR